MFRMGLKPVSFNHYCHYEKPKTVKLKYEFGKKKYRRLVRLIVHLLIGFNMYVNDKDIFYNFVIQKL